MRRTNFFVAAWLVVPAIAQAGTLRVCSEPNNLPFSNRAGQGFENKIARLVARDLGEKLEYTYALQTEKFVKRTLDAHKCDVMIGVSVGMNEVETTLPYYASTYVFVSRAQDHLALSSLDDPRLKRLKIGVHLLGDVSTPPTLALAQRGIVNNVHGFLIYGDYAKANPPARLIEAVADGQVDVAMAWGPMAGYFAKQSSVSLDVTPIAAASNIGPLKFRFAVAMGIRKGDTALRNKLNAVILHERNAIHKILVAYGIPLVALSGGADG
jgi:quinoprotein dehydrogenase-associated probable ABC transporter substrate-binding protein